jgi:hypothetical protein
MKSFSCFSVTNFNSKNAAEGYPVTGHAMYSRIDTVPVSSEVPVPVFGRLNPMDIRQTASGGTLGQPNLYRYLLGSSSSQSQLGTGSMLDSSSNWPAEESVQL